VESHAEPFSRGAAARQPNQCARAIQPDHIAEAAAGELEHVSPLTAAEIEDAIVGCEFGRCDDGVHLGCGVGGVLHHVAVRLQVQRIEKRAPPIRGQVAFEIGDEQAAAVTGILETHGFYRVSVATDMAGRDRVVHATSQVVKDG